MTNSPSPLVHIVDDDALFSDSLTRLLRSANYEVRAYSSVQAFLEKVTHGRPGCILLDIRLPGMSGLAFQKKFHEIGIEMPAILMTGYGDIPMTVEAMKAGAIDFLTKPFLEQDLFDAINLALQHDEATRRARLSVDELQARYNALTFREREVLALVLQGKMNKQTAAALGLSEITVKVHRRNVMLKMEASSLADLVRRAAAIVKG